MPALKILSLPVDDGGCGFYRIRQPFEMINRFTEHEARIISGDDDPVASTRAIAAADLLVIRPGAEEGLQRLLSIPEFKTKTYVMDIDDNTQIVSPYSAHYGEYGTHEYFDKYIGRQLWTDGVNIDIAKNKQRLQLLTYGMRNASLITVTTEKLAEYARGFNKNVEVLPNTINFERWWKPAFVHSRKLRVGWSGGISHYEDFYAIKEPLNHLMAKHQFTLVLAGTGFEGLIDKENKHLLEIHDWVPFKGHSYRMMCLNLDIALVPLADLPFNHYKSPIKFLEMAAMGVPSVVSNVGPYAEVAAPDTAMLYKNAPEFITAVESLIQDKKLRESVSSRALKMAKNVFDSKKRVNDWVSAYTSVVARNK